MKFPILSVALLIFTLGNSAAQDQIGQRRVLSGKWLIQSSVLVPENGSRISSRDYKPKQWLETHVPTTVLNALVNNGIYPDPRVGMNLFKIPDSSDEFNKKNDLEKYSYLPGKRNPWRDPYWYRTEFSLTDFTKGQRLWLEFKGINYRADVWLNGKQVADSAAMAGLYQRFRFDITDYAIKGTNCLAVRIHPVDHPGDPDLQLVPAGDSRTYYKKEIQKDVTYTVAIGYDCMPPIPDRNMGIWQDVFIEWTGQVDIRDPFVVTDLPLPDTSRANLTISAELVNTSGVPVSGVLKGSVIGADVSFIQKVQLAHDETKLVNIDPKPVILNPKLWWSKNYGKQHLYKIKLEFELQKGGNSIISDNDTVTFGVRKIGKELHTFNGTPGLRLLVNGKKVFSQGGWLQPELLFDMPRERMEAEVRYLTDANLNTVTVEDLPALNDEFLDACDQLGLMYWMSFYSSSWVESATNWPLDHKLLEKCGEDLIRRYRNHPSLMLYSCVGEGMPSEDIYMAWRKDIVELDNTRLFVPTIDVRTKAKWVDPDLPTGIHDANTFWDVTPPGYYQRVRAGGKWMFNTETSIITIPPISHLSKFIADLNYTSGPGSLFNPQDASWAHHDYTRWVKDFDPALKLYYGTPDCLVDYCWRAQLLSAERHRAWSEAVNHRMWDITSGVWQWKLNSCWPSVGWQIYDWFLKPLVSSYYYKSSFEPLHIQLSPVDGMITIVNRRLQPERDLDVDVSVYNIDMKLLWKQQTIMNIGPNTYRDVINSKIASNDYPYAVSIPPLSDLSPVYFVKLKLSRDGKLLSDNFYWLSSKPYAKDDPEAFRRGGFDLISASNTADFSALNDLPAVKLNVSQNVEVKGDEQVVNVSLHNPTPHLAFFIQLAVTKDSRGEEILPVSWEDNYFSLLPGETRQVKARYATKDLKGSKPYVEVGGWNIQTDYHCTGLTASKDKIKSGEPFTVTAKIRDTFLDGSRVSLIMDGEPFNSHWAWARGENLSQTDFKCEISKPGKHVLTVGEKSITVEVE
jgi:exo-1,4-beta-D-glucosaminidase